MHFFFFFFFSFFFLFFVVVVTDIASIDWIWPCVAPQVAWPHVDKICHLEGVPKLDEDFLLVDTGSPLSLAHDPYLCVMCLKITCRGSHNPKNCH